MRILVKSKNLRVKTFAAKDGKPGREITEQQAALDVGGEFPLPFWLSVPHDKPYEPGLYDFDPGSFRSNPFGGIELDPYNVRLSALALDKAAK
jgi:hypothetical protein